MEGETLSLEHIRKARGIMMQPIDVDRRLPIHSEVWDDYKRTFELSEAQMEKYFIKTVYIE